MDQVLRPDICVIGAGSGGLSVAAGAAQLGVETVLIEKGRMGGDCLNYGCVPSKSLIAAAGVAHTMRESRAFGVAPVTPGVDMRAVRDHVREVIAGIAPHDSVERFEGLGVRVIQAQARFRYGDEVEAGGYRIRARRFVVATGSRPAAPPIPGLEEVPYLTNETVFELDQLPRRLVVIGAGPIGCELAQAVRRLGAEVAIVDIGPMLAKDDPELVAIVRERLEAEGIEILDRVAVKRVESGPTVVVEVEGTERRVAGSHLLIAAGRKPNIEDLGLDAARISHGRAGIEVDARLRTSNRRVFAIGDVAGQHQFTHAASHHAGIVIKNALFRLPAKAASATMPWVTFTEPELAQAGLKEAEARQRFKDVEVATFAMAENDRARAGRATEGMVKVVARRSGRVLGVSLCGAHAGELVLPWLLAIDQKLKLSAMAGLIAPYPTLSEASKRAAGAFYTPRLFSERTRRIVRLLTRLG